MRSGIKDVLVLIFLIVICAVFFSRLFYPPIHMFSFPDFAQSDLWQQSYSSKYFLAESLKKGQLPLWNPYVGMGYPEFAKAEIGALFLPNLILFSFLSFPIAINLMYVVVFLTSSSGMYFLAKRFKFSLLASLASAIVFAYSAYFLTKFPHISRIQAASLIPWILLVLDVYLRKPRVIVGCLLSLLLAQQVYTGHFQIMFMTGLLVIGYTIYVCYEEKRPLKVLHLVWPAGLFVMLSAIQLLPAIELIQTTQRKAGFDQAGTLAFSFPWKKFMNFVLPFAGGSPHTGPVEHYSVNGGDIYWENVAYIGISGLFLALVGLLGAQKRTLYTLSLFLLVSAVFLMTGKHSPLYFIHSIVPFSFFRAPSKYIFLFSFALSLFVAYGVDTLSLKMTQFKIKKVQVNMLIFILICIITSELLHFYFTYSVSIPAKDIMEKPAVTEHIKESNRYRYISLGSGIVWNEIFMKDGWKSMDEYIYLENALRPNINTLYGVRSFDVYQILQSNRFSIVSDTAQELIRSQNSSEKSQYAAKNFMNMYNIDYIIAPKIPLTYGVSTPVPAPEKYLNRKLPPLEIVHRSEAQPRMYMVYSYEVARTVNEYKELLSDTTFNSKKQVILEKKLLQSFTEGKNTIDIKHETDQSIVASLETNKPGLLILGDSYYPGWYAYIDNKETEILAANINQRALVVPKGTHTIKFNYKPESFMRGRIISIAGYIFIVLLVGYFHFRQLYQYMTSIFRLPHRF